MDILEDIWYIRGYIGVILIMCLCSLFLFYSIRKNKYARFLPFLSIIWLVPFYIGTYNYDDNIALLFIVDVLFCNSMDIAIIYLGYLPLVLFLVVIGLCGFIISKRIKITYEKSSWSECLLLSPYPMFFLCGLTTLSCYKFLRLSMIPFVLLLIIDKIILIKYKHFYFQLFMKCSVTIIVSIFISFNPPSDLLIVLTDSMFDYALLQYWEHRPHGWSFSFWKRKMKGSK